MGFIGKAHQPRHFVIDGVTSRAKKQANAALRKIADQFFQHRERGVIGVDAKYDLEFGIVLAAKAGVVFIRLDIKILDGLQTADGRRETSILSVSPLGITEEMHRTIENKQIINRRDRGKEKNDVFGNRQDYRASPIGKRRG